MNRIEIEIMSPAKASAAFAEAWTRAAAGEPVAPRLAFGSYVELFSALSERRFELLRYVSAHPGLNIRRLAAGLERDYKNVHTDVKALLDLGLLEKDDHGWLTTPYDEIVIRADLTQAA